MNNSPIQGAAVEPATESENQSFGLKTTELVASPTNFQRVSIMNEAFGNSQGDPHNIDWAKVRAQCKNIFDEFIELQKAFGAEEATLAWLKAVRAELDDVEYTGKLDLVKVRDALCDINVFSYGAQHFMGIDGDRDMAAVVGGVMTRFIKDEADEVATIKRHAIKGVTKVYLEGEYPNKILKSAEDQPDAPKGKFLKSASFAEPVFYTPA